MKQGWINHVGQADSWGLRRNVLNELVIERGTQRGSPPKKIATATRSPLNRKASEQQNQ
jgi:hypothetical protein